MAVKDRPYIHIIVNSRLLSNNIAYLHQSHFCEDILSQGRCLKGVENEADRWLRRGDEKLFGNPLHSQIQSDHQTYQESPASSLGPLWAFFGQKFPPKKAGKHFPMRRREKMFETPVSKLICFPKLEPFWVVYLLNFPQKVLFYHENSFGLSWQNSEEEKTHSMRRR